MSLLFLFEVFVVLPTVTSSILKSLCRRTKLQFRTSTLREMVQNGPTTVPDQANEGRYAKDEREKNKRDIIAYFEKQRCNLKIVKTTKSPSGQIIDWIPIESQGIIASPPPGGPNLPELPDDAKDAIYNDTPILGDLECEGAELGPEGTVPVPRLDLSRVSGNRSLAELLTKSLPRPDASRTTTKALAEVLTPDPDADNHFYAQAYQFGKCYGGQGQYSCFDPSIEETNDMSLIQTGLLNEQLGFMQSVEVGLEVITDFYGDSKPHLFTYFRTHGTDQGPGIGGYNQDTATATTHDWNQIDGTIAPRTTFAPLSVVGDPNGQRRVQIATQLFEGNWWVWCQGRWIGYYSASLFQAAGPGSTETLASYADKIGYWGEVGADPAEKASPTTNMGSGQWPERGWPWSAYMHTLGYSPDETGLVAFWFDGTGGVAQPNPDLYKIVPHFTIDTIWGSYVWLGGPGAD